ncbi:MAG: LPS assembly lipoprotein LptE [Gemmatimonadota bacterium]
MLPRSTTYLIACSLVAALASGGCYGFSGGGGLPSHMNTAFVPPVQNDTPRFTLTERMTQSLLDAVRSKLGLQLAAEGEADLIVTARITRYTDIALNFDAQQGETTQVFQRRITITAEVEIFDTELDEMYWSSRSVTGVGEYEPENEQEEVGETIALDNLTQKIVDGAQSDW